MSDQRPFSARLPPETCCADRRAISSARRRRRKISESSQTYDFQADLGAEELLEAERRALHPLVLLSTARPAIVQHCPAERTNLVSAARRWRGALTVAARRVQGRAGKALLAQGGNGSKHRRLTEYAHPRDKHVGVCPVPPRRAGGMMLARCSELRRVGGCQQVYVPTRKKARSTVQFGVLEIALPGLSSSFLKAGVKSRLLSS